MSYRFSNDRVKRGLSAFIVGKIVSALAGLAAMVLVVRGLSVPDFAAYSVLFALVEVFTAVSGMGLAHVILRYVPELYATRRPTALRSLLHAAIGIRSIVLVAWLVLAFVAALPLARLINLDDLLPAFKVFLLVVAFRSTMHFLSQVLESTLHQNICQLAFAKSAIGRFAGMLWLLNQGPITLIDVIVLEAICDGVACVILLIGIARVSRQALTDQGKGPDDSSWWTTHRPAVVKFAIAAYAQHLATLPYGSNTNRLVGGALFGDRVMATFGFAQSLYEYFKKYLPTQLLIGLIRPIVVSRYVMNRNFAAAAELCDQALHVNLVFLLGAAAVLIVSGAELLGMLSAGKYGAEAAWLLIALLMLLCLESQRLVLEVLAQTVEKYALMIPSNLFLSASVLLGIALYSLLGSLAFPLANAFAIVWANIWVISRLKMSGQVYRHDWHGTSIAISLFVIAVVAGTAINLLGSDWFLAAGITSVVYSGLYALFLLGRTKAFVTALLGKQTKGVSTTDADRSAVPGSTTNNQAHKRPLQNSLKNEKKMKVGILTMHRVINYGSFMQAYALKRSIEALGHTVEFRDFPKGQPRHIGAKVQQPSFRDTLRKIPKKLLHVPSAMAKRDFRRQLHACFRNECWPLLGAPETPNYDLQADAMIIGSDEVFNYTQNHAFGYVPCLFGHGVQASIIASYAASAGYANWTDVENDGMAIELANGLNKFTHLAVRDANTSALVERCIGRIPELVVDPTLIHDFSDETPTTAVVEPGYLLVYAYEGRMDSENEIQAIRDYAQREGLRVVSAGAFHGWCDENVVVKPFELLRLFADATYVVTDTFHGSIFAMKAQRQFATLIRDESQWGSNSNKVHYLLEQFGMQSRIMFDMSELGIKLQAPAPYVQFDTRLMALQQASKAYLINVFREA
jgi:hypothetical protein